MDELNLTAEKVKINYLSWLNVISLSIVVGVFLYVTLVTPLQIGNRQMEPNLEPGDLVIANKLGHFLYQNNANLALEVEYNRGDIIAFRNEQNELLVRRIIGLPGEEILLSGGKILVNGQKLSETYLSPSTRTYGADFLADESGKTVPENSWLVMSDNRNLGTDSRHEQVGFVAADQLIGKVFFRYWPLHRISGVETYTYFDNTQ